MAGSKGPRAHPPTSAPVRASYRDDVYLIRVEGRLGERACFELRHVLAQAEASSASRILLNIDRLTNLDARGLHAILQASRRSAADGNRLRVTRGNGHVAEIFRLTALDQTVRFADEGAARRND